MVRRHMSGTWHMSHTWQLTEFLVSIPTTLGNCSCTLCSLCSLQEKSHRGSCRVSGIIKRPMSFTIWFCLQRFLPTSLEFHLHHGTWHYSVETIKRSLLYLFFSGKKKYSGLVINFFGLPSPWCLLHLKKNKGKWPFHYLWHHKLLLEELGGVVCLQRLA